HQAVVRDSCPPPIRTDDGYRLLEEVDIDHVAELHLRVHMLPQHFPRRRRDRAGWEDAGRDLVEQRLEEVVVRSVDECDLDRGALEEPRCEQAAEPCANDHDPVACQHGVVNGGTHASICLSAILHSSLLASSMYHPGPMKNRSRSCSAAALAARE